MAKQKKYTPKKLREAVDRYYASISRTVTAKEKVDSGRKDKDGHIIFEEREIMNDLGEPITYVEYVLPPTVEDMCRFLGIVRQTWNNYCRDEKYLDATTRAQGRRRAYLERELLNRSGKDLRGVEFDLKNNFDCSDRVTVEMGDKAVAATIGAGGMSIEEKQQILLEIARQFSGDSGEMDAAEMSTDA